MYMQAVFWSSISWKSNHTILHTTKRGTVNRMMTTSIIYCRVWTFVYFMLIYIYIYSLILYLDADLYLSSGLSLHKDACAPLALNMIGLSNY